MKWSAILIVILTAFVGAHEFLDGTTLTLHILGLVVFLASAWAFKILILEKDE